MGFIQRLFGGKEVHFQKQVLNFLQHHSAQIIVPSDPLSVQINGVVLDLRGLYDKCQKNQVQAPELIQQYFSFPLAFAVRQEYSWNGAESMIRPQLVPAEVARRFDIQLFPFAGPIAVCVVVKDQSRQMFVRESDLQSWNVAREELLNLAVVNLDSDPVETEVTITDGTDRFIGLESHDGFDAARILLPRIRDFAAAKLGKSYLAGLPNRDFLILWSKECSPRFQEYAIEKIETDYSIQDYPLTAARFDVNESSITTL